jgi:YkoY family integral membrane protein
MLEALHLPETLTPQTFLILPVLIALEAVLSADNAIALAALTQGLRDPELEKKALNIGLILAYVLRMGLILVASQVVNQWQFELAGAGYLLWLVYQHFTSPEDEDGEHSEPRFANLWQAIPVIALTDLAFSLDSVTTAIAVSRETWLVLLGGTIGIIALRFMAGLFMKWLDEYERLEDAGYVTVALVGFRLLIRVLNDNLVPPEWMMITAIGIIFAWGFSKKNEGNEAPEVTGDRPVEPVEQTIDERV